MFPLLFCGLALGLAILGYEKLACPVNDWSAVFPHGIRTGFSTLSAPWQEQSLLAGAGGTTKSCLWLDDNEDVVEGSTLNLAMGVGMERGREGRGSLAKMAELCRNPELGEGKGSSACGVEKCRVGCSKKCWASHRC